jgi:hypothetical protein
MAEPLDSLAKLLSDYPNMGPGALVLAGATIGFTVGWGVWQARNSHLKQVNESLKEVLADKVPISSIAHLFRPRRPRLGPSIVAVCLVGAAIGAVIWYFQGIASSKTPVATVVHDPPTAEQIRQAAGEELAKVSKERDDLRGQNDSLKRENDNLRQAKLSPPPPTQSNLTADEIATKIEVWASIDRRMDDLARILNRGYSMLDTWVADARSNGVAEVQRAEELAASVSMYRTKLDNLRSTYIGFSDIAEALAEAAIPPGKPPIPGTLFDRLLRSTTGFAQELASVGNPLPDNLEDIMRARTGAVRRDLNAVREWQSTTRQTSNAKRSELEKSK